MGNALGNLHDLSGKNFASLKLRSRAIPREKWIEKSSATHGYDPSQSDERSLKLRTPTWSGPITCATLNLTLHLELQLQDFFQPVNEFRSQPMIQARHKFRRTSTKISCVDLERMRHPGREVI